MRCTTFRQLNGCSDKPFLLLLEGELFVLGEQESYLREIGNWVVCSCENNKVSIQLSSITRFILIINQKLSSVQFQEIEQYPDEEKDPLKIKQ